MKSLLLKTELSHHDAAQFKGKRLDGRHYTDLVADEHTAVYDKHGSVVGMLLKNVIPESVQTRALPALLTLRGDLTNRATVVGGGSQLPGIRVDGTLSPRRRVPKSILAAHGGKGDQLGFLDDKSGQYCRETGWTRRRPDVLAACLPLIHRVDQLYKAALPEHYARQMKWVDAVDESLKLHGTSFTTVTVNKNNRTAAHTDRGDVRDGIQGGFLILPRFGIAFDFRPGDLLLVNVHELHANAPFEGERVSCVYYAREKMHLCAVRNGGGR
jgi:hypothetical protein